MISLVSLNVISLNLKLICVPVVLQWGESSRWYGSVVTPVTLTEAVGGSRLLVTTQYIRINTKLSLVATSKHIYKYNKQSQWFSVSPLNILIIIENGVK